MFHMAIKYILIITNFIQQHPGIVNITSCNTFSCLMNLSSSFSYSVFVLSIAVEAVLIDSDCFFFLKKLFIVRFLKTAILPGLPHLCISKLRDTHSGNLKQCTNSPAILTKQQKNSSKLPTTSPCCIKHTKEKALHQI